MACPQTVSGGDGLQTLQVAALQTADKDWQWGIGLRPLLICTTQNLKQGTL